MKKNRLVLAVLLVLIFSSCQATPENQIVINKDEEKVEEMIEKVVKTEEIGEDNIDNNSIILNGLDYFIPERMECIIESDLVGAKTTVEVDAEILLPQYTLPMAKAVQKKITYEQIYNVITLLEQDNKFYNKLFAESVFTKKQIQQQINYYLYEIANCTEEMDAQKANYQTYINELYEKMDSAPDSYEDIDIKDIENTDITEDMLEPVELTEDNFDVKNYSLVIGEKYYNDELIIHASDFKKQQYIKYSKGINTTNKALILLNDLSLIESCEFTVEEAQKMAEIYVEALDSELKIESYGALIEREYLVGDTIEWKDVPYGYVLVYTRQVNGVNINYTDGTDLLGISEQEIFAEPYCQEFLKVTISEEGIIAFEYYCPMTINETIGLETELLSFDKVQNIFEKHIVLNGLEESTEVYVEINKIKLGLMRIAQPNKPNEYLLVPVWDFYGGSIRPAKGGALNDNYKERLTVTFGRSYLTINAIDGSIINRSLGY